MALLIRCEAESGFVIEDSYARIHTANGGKDGGTIKLDYYVSMEMFNQEKKPLKTEFYQFAPSVDDGAPNFIKQGYEYLKTMDKFANAIDC